MLKMKRNSRGDTIVEVLIAIAIAAFAIGTSYAIANRSLQRAISARERNEAVNDLQSQISALKIREKLQATNFSAFEAPAAGTKHFCLNTSSFGPTDPTNPWAPYANSINDSTANNLAANDGNYSAYCKMQGSSSTFYVDIGASSTPSSRLTTNPTIYKVVVRWAEVGSGDTQSAVAYYRF
jgi:type II secretory pathway pseudopilin PulG